MFSDLSEVLEIISAAIIHLEAIVFRYDLVQVPRIRMSIVKNPAGREPYKARGGPVSSITAPKGRSAGWEAYRIESI